MCHSLLNWELSNLKNVRSPTKLVSSSSIVWKTFPLERELYWSEKHHFMRLKCFIASWVSCQIWQILYHQQNTYLWYFMAGLFDRIRISFALISVTLVLLCLWDQDVWFYPAPRTVEFAYGMGWFLTWGTRRGNGQHKYWHWKASKF